MSISTLKSSTDRVTIASRAHLHALLRGASQVTMAAWVNPRTLSTNGPTSDCVLSTAINVSSAGLMLKLARVSSTSYRVGFAGRAGASDTASNINGSFILRTGQWAHIAIVVDVPKDLVHFYVNGRYDTSTARAFVADRVSVSGTLTGLTERIGHRPLIDDVPGGLDGFIEDVGLWKDDIGPNSMAEIAAGASPSAIDPDCLVAHWPLRTNSDLRNLRNDSPGVISGAIATGPSPPRVSRLRRISIPYLINAAGSGPQTITLGAATRVATAHAATLSAGSADLALGAATRTATAHAATLTAGAADLALGAATRTATAHALTLTGGPVDLALGAATRTATAHAATLTAGAADLALGAATRTATAHAAALAAGAVDLPLGAATRVAVAYGITLEAGAGADQDLALPAATRSPVAYALTLQAMTLTPGDIAAIADAVWAHPQAVELRAKLARIDNTTALIPALL